MSFRCGELLPEFRCELFAELPELLTGWQSCAEDALPPPLAEFNFEWI
jgi:hypothetical protein